MQSVMERTEQETGQDRLEFQVLRMQNDMKEIAKNGMSLVWNKQRKRI